MSKNNKSNARSIEAEIHDEVNAAPLASTTDIASAIDAARAQAGKRGPRAIKNRTYTFAVGNPTVRLAPQAVTILEAIAALGKTSVTEQELHDAVEAANFATKQGKWRVFQFYRPALIEAGWLTLC